MLQLQLSVTNATLASINPTPDRPFVLAAVMVPSRWAQLKLRALLAMPVGLATQHNFRSLVMLAHKVLISLPLVAMVVCLALSALQWLALARLAVSSVLLVISRT
jgi:hypothetical protein